MMGRSPGGTMRRLTLGVCVLLLVCLTISPLIAQNRDRSGGGGAGDRARVGATSSPAVSTYSATPSYSGGTANPSVNTGYRPLSPAGYSGGTYTISPNLQGTSFGSYNLYNNWNDYYFYLNRYYSLNPTYFTRFYNNREPLVTPAMLRLTLRQPLFLSTEMLRMIDQLEMLYRDSLAGKAMDKESLIDKAQSIRKLAKVIRENRTLSLVDLRSERNVVNEDDFGALSLESIAKIRELALNLNHQLSNMISASSSSTISVESYKEASFESISKGIEKACKAIENSSKRL
jgi:hypothetical protein